MSLSPGLATALAAEAPLTFFALEILLPGEALRLLDGSGDLIVNGNEYLGLDPTYGALVGPDAFQDGSSAEAPHLTFQIMAPTNAAAAAICSPAAQGSAVSLWFGAVNRITGGVIADPILLWQGDLDTTAWTVDRGQRAVRCDCESIWDRFFDTDEGILLDNATHQSIWPGELGLEYVTQVQMQLPWGADTARPIVVHDVINGSPSYSNSYGGGEGAALIGWIQSF